MIELCGLRGRRMIYKRKGQSMHTYGEVAISPPRQGGGSSLVETNLSMVIDTYVYVAALVEQCLDLMRAWAGRIRVTPARRVGA